MDQPLSTRPGKPALYRVQDSKLRLYLAILRGAREQVRRSRPTSAFRLVERRWSTWRGRMVEPLVREALELAAVDGALGRDDIEAVGGWWNRAFDTEVDLVALGRAPVARHVRLVGSIKWLAGPFDRHDMADLAGAAPQIPGFDPDTTTLAVVSLSGLAPEVPAATIALNWGPEDLIAAWRG